ncbi:allergin-1 isoform X1 [Equus przewalskii]|uniref:Mast cell immunoglobulin like receptor 1 n=3 Tax=Equus TaxID=9789 RepID=F7B604_HORSE|nr:allergin-1 isoform X1 [Equus caballus]XP_008516495.1 PREDICTED: allergin-1 isoform X1 [Equus przewalskii]XP_008516496.1 PREDICTED: allergin-1 isoform X1 [Equus przewalskii]XP_014594764.1 allergin-1 isoform X1 [Equus caballus]
MWCHLNKPFFMQQFVGIFSLLTSQTAALDCETMKKTNEFPSPKVYSETDVIMKGQNVSLFCSNQNKSLQITYVMFRGMKHLGTWDGKGEPMIFNLRISEAGDLGPYKCKTQVSNCSRYSQEFSFTFANPVTTPVLNISAFQTETARYITLRCISYNGSLPINYTFFEKDVAISPAISKNVREPAEFNLTERITGEREEYRCKAKNRLPNHAKYSQPFTMPSTGGDSCPFCLQLLLPGLLLLLIVIILMLAFWILPKYKARKAMRDNAPRNYGNKPMEVGIYANVCQNQADDKSVPGLEPRQCVSTAQDGTGHSKEIHYATPVFQEVAQGDHEAHNDCKTGYVYSELVL